jgi:hypothetical protein
MALHSIIAQSELTIILKLINNVTAQLTSNLGTMEQVGAYLDYPVENLMVNSPMSNT